MTRATLAEHDGLPLRSASRHAHVCDLGYWEEREWIIIDLDADCYRLTVAGRNHAHGPICGNCAFWNFVNENRGRCLSRERCDAGRADAGITREYETCEAHINRAKSQSEHQEG